VAIKRAVFLLRRARTMEDVVMASERVGLKFSVARTSRELTSLIKERPVDQALVDEGWKLRGAPLPGDPGAFVVPMGRTVGTAGETALKIIVRPGTNQIVTAYPVVP